MYCHTHLTVCKAHIYMDYTIYLLSTSLWSFPYSGPGHLFILHGFTLSSTTCVGKFWLYYYYYHHPSSSSFLLLLLLFFFFFFLSSWNMQHKIPLASKSSFQIILSSSYCLFHSFMAVCYLHSLVFTPTSMSLTDRTGVTTRLCIHFQL